LAGVDLPLSAIRKQMASALDLIIQIHRFRNGKRRIVLISEVTGTEGDVITLQDIFQFETETEKFKVTGLVPTFLSRLKEQGIELPSNYFF
jgi:pilus assembly protein CpaF